MRAFLAISLPEDAADALVAVQAGLPMGRPVAAENLHLTLVFLGEIDDATAEELHDALSAVRLPPVTLSITGLGTFGEGAPRALWAAISADQGLVLLQSKLETLARRAGIALPSKRFVPHITLARFRHGTEADDAFHRYLADRAGFRFPSFAAHSFGLFASTLRPEGPTYETLAQYPLSG